MPKSEVSTFSDFPKTTDFDGSGLWFYFARQCCLHAEFHALDAISTMASVVLRSWGLSHFSHPLSLSSGSQRPIRKPQTSNDSDDEVGVTDVRRKKKRHKAIGHRGQTLSSRRCSLYSTVISKGHSSACSQTPDQEQARWVTPAPEREDRSHHFQVHVLKVSRDWRGQWHKRWREHAVGAFCLGEPRQAFQCWIKVSIASLSHRHQAAFVSLPIIPSLPPFLPPNYSSHPLSTTG